MKRPWMPFYVADYLTDTAHLSAAEHGAYLLLILHYWTRRGLPSDEESIRRITRLSPRQWTQSRDILRDLFSDDWRHKRVDAELAQVIEKSKTNSANAKLRHKVRKPSADVSQVPSHTHTHTHTEEESLFSNENRVPGSDPIPVDQKPEKLKSLQPVSDWPSDYRDQFWGSFPRKTEKKAAMAKLEAVKKSGLIPWARFIAGVYRYRDHSAGTEERYIKHPTTWLNRGCWDDEHPERKQQSPGEGRSYPASQPRQTREDAIIAGVGRFASRYLNSEQPTGRDGASFDFVDVTPKPTANR